MCVHISSGSNVSWLKQLAPHPEQGSTLLVFLPTVAECLLMRECCSLFKLINSKTVWARPVLLIK